MDKDWIKMLDFDKIQRWLHVMVGRTQRLLLGQKKVPPFPSPISTT